MSAYSHTPASSLKTVSLSLSLDLAHFVVADEAVHRPRVACGRRALALWPAAAILDFDAGATFSEAGGKGRYVSFGHFKKSYETAARHHGLQYGVFGGQPMKQQEAAQVSVGSKLPAVKMRASRNVMTLVGEEVFMFAFDEV